MMPNNHLRLTTLSLVLALASFFHAHEAWAFELVETGVSKLAPDGRHVGVNVPGFFSMQLDTRGPGRGLKMTQSIMLGFVKVDMDRVNGTDGKMRGPLSVKVAGISVYNNRQPPVARDPYENGNRAPSDVTPPQEPLMQPSSELPPSPADNQESNASPEPPMEATELPLRPTDEPTPED